MHSHTTFLAGAFSGSTWQHHLSQGETLHLTNTSSSKLPRSRCKAVTFPCWQIPRQPNESLWPVPAPGLWAEPQLSTGSLHPLPPHLELKIKVKAKHFKGKTKQNTCSGTKKPHWTPWRGKGHSTEELSRTDELIFSTFFSCLLPEYLWCLTTALWGRGAADSEPGMKQSAPGCVSNKNQEHNSTHLLEILSHPYTILSSPRDHKWHFSQKNQMKAQGRIRQGSGPTYLTSASGLLSWLLGIQFSIKSLCVLGLLLAHFCFFSFLEDEEGMLPLVALWLRGEEFTTPLTFL